MKLTKQILTLIFIGISTLCFAQNMYKKVYKYDVYNKDWALVKDITGSCGFIDRDGKEVVQTIYAKIGKFTENFGKYALVKDVAGCYGLIDQNGKDVIPCIYRNKHEVTEQLKTLKD